jgi:serine palmitoyltransferase
VNEKVINSLEKFGVNNCSSRLDYGTNDLHIELEKKIAKFIGKESAIIFGMGYATNSTSIPIISGFSDTLVISDSLNHTSIIVGAKLSIAKVKIFKHNGIL